MRFALLLVALAAPASAVADASLPPAAQAAAPSTWVARCAAFFERARSEVAKIDPRFRAVTVVADQRTTPTCTPVLLDYVGLEIVDEKGRSIFSAYAGRGVDRSSPARPGRWLVFKDQHERGPAMLPRAGPWPAHPRLVRPLDRVPRLYQSRWESHLWAELFVDRAPPTVLAQFKRSFQAAVEACELPP